MNDYFDVYVGNLSTSISEKQLQKFFAPFGDIDHVWINDTYRHRHHTYGFVTFYNLDDARKACQINNNKWVVNISQKTQQKLDRAVRKKSEKSILKDELPKIKQGTKKQVLEKILKQKVIEYQQEDKDFIVTFKNALIEIENNEPLSNEHKIIKHAPEKMNFKELENIVVRYYEPVKKGNRLFKEIDFDLCKENKKLKT